MTVMDSIQRYFDGWNNRDVDAILQSLTDTGTYEDPGTGQPIGGDATARLYSGHLVGLSRPAVRDHDSCCDRTGHSGGRMAHDRDQHRSDERAAAHRQNDFVEGSDFFALSQDKIASVRGYFDGGAVPRQLGLDIIVQPAQIGPFRFGTSTMVQTGKTEEPGAFSITYLEANDAEEVLAVREGSRKSMVDMLDLDGFIGATTATIGTRMVTISAWDSPDAPRQMMKTGAHAQEQKTMLSGPVAKYGFTSVWDQEPGQPVSHALRKLRKDVARRQGRTGLRLRGGPARARAVLVGSGGLTMGRSVQHPVCRHRPKPHAKDRNPGRDGKD